MKYALTSRAKLRKASNIKINFKFYSDIQLLLIFPKSESELIR